MSDKAISKFIDTMILHFPPFRWDEAEEAQWAQSLTMELRAFSTAVLEKAATDTIRTRKDRKIPLVSECINACLDARKFLDAKEGAEALAIVPQKAKSYDDKKSLANDLVMGPEGRQAAKEGWIGILHDYAKNHGRLPPPSEFPGMKREAKEFDAAYARCVRGDGMFAAKQLQELGAKMLKRRNELADMVLHGVVR
jgi:hypothetical protein